MQDTYPSTSSGKKYKCVVLDLETTWLSPEYDTIIEVAAIRFDLEKGENWEWKISNQDERSMLIDPERELTEEISMITHISSSMLVGKPKWHEVRDRIADFIGDGIIIGHNVLFDVAMFKTHGINLTNNDIIDTFELSTIFSHTSESLNLWFLAAKYGFTTTKWEHRALWDVEVCLELFIKYLQDGSELEEKELSILRLIQEKEEKKNIWLFLEIVWQSEGSTFSLDHDFYFPQEKSQRSWREKRTLYEYNPDIQTISLGWSSSKIWVIQDALQTYKKIHIIASSGKSGENLYQRIRDAGWDIVRWLAENKFCSILAIEEMLADNNPLERKLSILLVRILLWLQRTKTWIIDELKMYWKEYEYKDRFTITESEEHIFLLQLRDSIEESKISLYDTFDYVGSLHDTPECLIIEDIWFFDDKLRRIYSEKIDISWLIQDIFEWNCDTIVKNRILHALSLIQHIYEWIPDRPNPNPVFEQWDFAETYFYDQSRLWKEWWTWLLLATRILLFSKQYLVIENDAPTYTKKKYNSILQSLEFLIDYHTHTSRCTSIIIEIGKNGTQIKYIPRNLEKEIKKIYTSWATEKILLLGYWIWWEKVSDYLSRELFIETQLPVSHIKTHDIKILEDLKNINLSGWIILTTSMKHIRELGKECEKLWIKALMQWISGWKSKILSNFEKNRENLVLIWLIESWKDEYTLWKESGPIIIAKLPFDPPTDPYFLARTVWMSNNFSLYSEPIVILRINNLIWNIRESGYTWTLYSLDSRLENTVWGQSVIREILEKNLWEK